MKKSLLIAVLFMFVATPSFAVPDVDVYNDTKTLSSNGDTVFVDFGGNKIRQYEVRIDTGQVNIIGDTNKVGANNSLLEDGERPYRGPRIISTSSTEYELSIRNASSGEVNVYITAWDW